MKRFPDHSRVCFLGDSITAANQFVPLIIDAYKTQLPEAGVKFYNAGISGGSVYSARRFIDDLYSHNPTHVVIMLGMNDSWRDHLKRPSPEREEGLKKAYDSYNAGMRTLIGELQEHGITVILCTPSPYAEPVATGEEPLPGGFALLEHYSAAVRAMAKELNLDLIDYHSYLSARFLRGNLYNPDHVHPNFLGHFCMAECFLKAQGIDIGPFHQIPEYLQEWCEKIAILRQIFAVEYMVIPKDAGTLEEKMAFINDYLDNEKYPREYFMNIAKVYRENKPHEAEIADRADEIMNNLYA